MNIRVHHAQNLSRPSGRSKKRRNDRLHSWILWGFVTGFCIVLHFDLVLFR